MEAVLIRILKELQTDAFHFLIRTREGTEQSEPGNSRQSSKWMIFLLEPVRKRSSLSLAAHMYIRSVQVYVYTCECVCVYVWPDGQRVEPSSSSRSGLQPASWSDRIFILTSRWYHPYPHGQVCTWWSSSTNRRRRSTSRSGCLTTGAWIYYRA